MTSTHGDLDHVLVSELELWRDGPPHELFGQLRSECPVHWTGGIPDYPGEPGFWSVTRSDDVHAVSRDWRTYSSELGGITSVGVFPLEADPLDVHRDGPAPARPSQDAVPGRVHTEADRRARARDQGDRGRGARPAGRAASSCDLVTDVAQPVVSRVIGSFMGIPPEDDAAWAKLMNAALAVGDPDMNPHGVETLLEDSIPEIFDRCRRLIAERRERPTDDLTSVLVHAEVEGREARRAGDRDGVLPADGRRQRQHQGDLLQRDAGAPRAPGAAPAVARRIPR